MNNNNNNTQNVILNAKSALYQIMRNFVKTTQNALYNATSALLLAENYYCGSHFIHGHQLLSFS